MSDPRYPIGKFSIRGPLTAEQRQQSLADIEQTPARLRSALAGLSDSATEHSLPRWWLDARASWRITLPTAT